MNSQLLSEVLSDPIKSEVKNSAGRRVKIVDKALTEITQKYEEAKKASDEYREKYLRERAEMENYIKIKDKETDQIRKNANGRLIKDFLPILDAMDAAAKVEKDNNMIRIRDQILGILSKYGLKPIDAKGKKFDPFLHEAIGVVSDGEDGMIYEEVQKGYLFNDEVLRTSKVIVVKR
ncbi:MAG: nucleotide exchange factor GrpE [Thermoplasmata archaeon]